MAEPIRASAPRRWALRAAYAGLCLVLIMGSLLPLQTRPALWAGPDLLLCLTMVWSLRRPELAPLPVIAGIFFLADLLQMRPPGLMAALATFVVHRMQRRARRMRDRAFMTEWVTASLGIMLVLMGYWVILGLFLLDRPPLPVMLSQLAATILVYPLLAGLSAALFGLRRAALGEVDSLGHRL
ncbi:rod shape-determining protein MreD [Pseudooceanicola antarcticus]|uniref:Rod shape-determining protein MreD n=1 Tax=Pseudooceanicola antarcticus TaxID=1247613 RepID=A0A285IED3_9RHOB|nr:rod shape-determining protein MreD [Pseudooceanicola antarcticus]PJE29183.1 rod shape-determining protein MreD [Pseudooceanicola antarcticus]SNY46293.1 rod shape-determining protein MreD [Pseudooceanicola antarcticus]